jgi:hypothetical protein
MFELPGIKGGFVGGPPLPALSLFNDFYLRARAFFDSERTTRRDNKLSLNNGSYHAQFGCRDTPFSLDRVKKVEVASFAKDGRVSQSVFRFR